MVRVAHGKGGVRTGNSRVRRGSWLGNAALAMVVITGLTVLPFPPSTPSAQAAALLQTEEVATLVKETPLSGLPDPSIDPTGITYLAHKDRLLISDSEIDEETALFAGVNLFEVTRSGAATATGVTPDPAGKLEPTGLAYDPVTRHVFVTNDSTDDVSEIDAGADGVYGSADDMVTVPDFTPLNISDLEDAAFDTNDRRLYLLDGADQTLYGIWPGANGVFDGLPPAGDDGFTIIELAPLGILDSAGIAYRATTDTLLLSDLGDDALYELSKSGAIIRTVDLSGLKIPGVPFSASDVVLAPASDGSGATHIYVLDRGADNGTPNDGIPPPMDGRLLELTAPFENGAFDDDDGSIFEGDINWLAAEGITKGCNPPDNNFFCPNDPVTRGQMAAFLVRALSLTDGAGSNVFVDDNNSVFEADIEKLEAAGITKGCNPPVNNQYCPSDVVTRGQMAAFMVRAFGYTFVSGNLFVDDNGSIFEDDINKLATAGVTKGCNPPTNNMFCPDDPVTRGQMAAFLHRALG